MHEQGVLAPQLLAHLADGFDEGQRFDVADRTADFDDGQIDILARLFFIALLISLVTCGITCTVLPR